MHYPLDYIEFALSAVAAVAFSVLVVVGVITGQLYLGRHLSIRFQERSSAFLSWFLLFAWVAFLSVREAVGFLHHSGTP